MTAYEKELLALAVERAPNHEFSVWRDEDGTWCADTPICAVARSVTLADALTALLRDLGVEVPERPSARQVNAAYLSAVPLADAAPCSFAVGRLRDLYARDPLTVLALLEGDQS